MSANVNKGMGKGNGVNANKTSLNIGQQKQYKGKKLNKDEKYRNWKVGDSSYKNNYERNFTAGASKISRITPLRAK